VADLDGNNRVLCEEGGVDVAENTSFKSDAEFSDEGMVFADRVDSVRGQLELWKIYDQHLDSFFVKIKALGIDLTPLHIRLVNDSRLINDSRGLDRELDRLQILLHLREYLSTIVRAYELIVEQNVGAIAVHEQKSLSDAAIEFVMNSRNSSEDIKSVFLDIIADIKSEEMCTRKLAKYIESCR